MRREVDREYARPDLVVALIVETRHRGNAGIVHENVDASEMLCDRFDGLGDGATIGNVELPGPRGAAFLLDVARNLLYAVAVDVDSRNARAFAGKDEGGRPSHAAGR